MSIYTVRKVDGEINKIEANSFAFDNENRCAIFKGVIPPSPRNTSCSAPVIAVFTDVSSVVLDGTLCT